MTMDVNNIFKYIDNNITIHIVTKSFANRNCADYFRQFKGTKHYINTNEKILSAIAEIMFSIGAGIPNIAELIADCFDKKSYLIIPKLIASFSKLFGTLEHQASEEKHLDPIILEEGELMPKYINQLISLNKDIVRPRIIVILKDENLEYAKKLLSGCPHNTNLNLIYNEKKNEVYRIINCGADNPDEFLDAFSRSCLSTCSRTSANVIYNEDWAENSIVRTYGPDILRIRSNLLYNDKTLIRKDLNMVIENIQNTYASSGDNYKLLRAFECMLKLFRVFCNDGGYNDMQDALFIAKELDSDILLAHVYRNANFLNQFSLIEKMQLMDTAYKIFTDNEMIDHAVCCLNNKIVRQFDTDDISIKDFLDLQNEANDKVPGLVGLSHIHNNTGASLLTKGHYEEAIIAFDEAVKFAFRPERCIQNAAILSNKLVSQACYHCKIEERELLRTLEKILNNTELLNLPFLSARYALNIIAVALNQNVDFGIELLNRFPVTKLIQNSLNTNPLGSGQLLLQMGILDEKYSKLNMYNQIHIPKEVIPAKGIRSDFIKRTGYNPCSFSMWF
ncbi:MAG: transcriptional repressor [Clostridia bacterium]|nr:transcriptional repressor [Clostridia bacterium]